MIRKWWWEEGFIWCQNERDEDNIRYAWMFSVLGCFCALMFYMFWCLLCLAVFCVWMFSVLWCSICFDVFCVWLFSVFGCFLCCDIFSTFRCFDVFYVLMFSMIWSLQCFLIFDVFYVLLSSMFSTYVLMFSMFVSEEEGLKIYKQDTSLRLSLAFGENTATKTIYSICS